MAAYAANAAKTIMRCRRSSHRGVPRTACPPPSAAASRAVPPGARVARDLASMTVRAPLAVTTWSSSMSIVTWSPVDQNGSCPPL